MAPANFGAYGGDLLVGNFGNGRISAYQPARRRSGLQGPVPGRERRADRDRRALGDRVRQRRGAGPSTTSTSLAGPTGETHGLFGFIAVG